ncbi:hypothetical protein [Lonsdalea populi]|uniref:hypothetical protein n=1 Tax=Lonsdalea populi TaxID=1172565 RepID=UPI0021ABDB8A|nr:hypothetical protein [Lonsdalea populi]
MKTALRCTARAPLLELLTQTGHNIHGQRSEAASASPLSRASTAIRKRQKLAEFFAAGLLSRPITVRDAIWLRGNARSLHDRLGATRASAPASAGVPSQSTRAHDV